MQAQILTLIMPAMAMIFAVVFVVLWWQDRTRSHILAYASWFAAITVAISLQTWIFGAIGPMEVLAFHWISSAGLIALLWGLAKRRGGRIPLLTYILLTACSSVILWYARVYGEQEVLLMTQNTNAAMLLALGAFNEWRSVRRSVADRALMWILTGFAAYGFFRPSMTILARSQMTMEQYQTSIFFTINVTVTTLLAMLVAMALIATIYAGNMQEQQVKSEIDPLSGLRMRGAFETEARNMIDEAFRANAPVSLILADIDHFKKVNDSFGHVVGDRVIARFGKLIDQLIRSGDVSGRVGGEEFCVLVWDCTVADAAQLAERIRLSLARPDHSDDADHVPITASFGVAQWRESESYAQLFERADKALYAAKGNGRNQVASEGKAPLGDSGLVVPLVAHRSAHQARLAR